jgi:hypothetical protein
VSYGFPIINFCNPGVHDEMPCISVHGYSVQNSVAICLYGFKAQFPVWSVWGTYEKYIKSLTLMSSVFFSVSTLHFDSVLIVQQWQSVCLSEFTYSYMNVVSGDSAFFLLGWHDVSNELFLTCRHVSGTLHTTDTLTHHIPWD